MERKIKVDGHECTLREFIHDNTEQEGQISLEELLAVINAMPGQKLHVGFSVEIEIL